MEHYISHFLQKVIKKSCKRSNSIRGLESKEPTKEVAYIYYWNSINYFFYLHMWNLKNKIIIQHLSAEVEKVLSAFMTTNLWKKGTWVNQHLTRTHCK
jgi:hypothetical protein